MAIKLTWSFTHWEPLDYNGKLRHLTLIQIDKPTADNWKIVLNSISYWKTNITASITYNEELINLQGLCSIAIRVLVLPDSEALCERCFSQLKLIHNYFRITFQSDIIVCFLKIELNLIL